MSKTLVPGLRLGWIVAPAWLAPTVADTKFLADVATPVLDQVTLAILIETGALDRHVRRIAARYSANRGHLLGAVARHLPEWTVTGIAAGLHAVLTPATTIPATALQHAADKERDLQIVPLAAYSHGDRPRCGLVVGYGAATAGQIDRGVAALAARLASPVSGRTVR